MRCFVFCFGYGLTYVYKLRLNQPSLSPPRWPSETFRDLFFKYHAAEGIQMTGMCEGSKGYTLLVPSGERKRRFPPSPHWTSHQAWPEEGKGQGVNRAISGSTETEKRVPGFAHVNGFSEGG